MKSTFKTSDCIYLLKDLTGVMQFTSFEDKEKSIRAGANYSEMITEEAPIEYDINQIFEKILYDNADKLARYVGIVAEQIYLRGQKDGIIVSLARAGSPVGAIIKRYIKFKYHVDLPHYSISIIRGKGIDKNAVNYIRRQHPDGVITFVDAWTGKGSIARELRAAIAEYNIENGSAVSSDLAVLADPAHLSAIAGTKKDVCIPNACLNSTVSGLVSRTILNDKYISHDDFHGAIRYEHLSDNDMTNHFLDVIENAFRAESYAPVDSQENSCVDIILNKIKTDFPVIDINKIKLSIGESSRALIRRKPYKVLVKNINNPDLSFVLHLAKKKDVDVAVYDTMDYECITLIK